MNRTEGRAAVGEAVRVSEKSVTGKSVPGKGMPGKSESGKSVTGKSVPGKGMPGKNVSGKSEPGKGMPGNSVSGIRTGVAAICPLTIDSIYGDFAGYPGLGEEELAGRHSLQLGGGAVVVPVVLQGLGIPAKLGTFLGQDKISCLAEQLLEELGFTSYENLYHGDGQPVVLSTVFTFPEDRSFLSYIDTGAQAGVDGEQAFEFLKDSRICIAPLQEDACRRLKEHGVCQVFDVHWSEDLSLEKYAGILEHVDYFAPNEKEAFRMTGKENTTDALLELAKVTRQPIIKLGRAGCQTILEGRVVTLSSVNYFQPVDATGAGDNFIAGLIYGIYKGWPLERCMQMANVLGGYATTGLGCFPKALSEEEALDYLAFYKSSPGKGGKSDNS